MRRFSGELLLNVLQLNDQRFFCYCGPSAKRLLHYFEKQIHKLTSWISIAYANRQKKHMITCKKSMHACMHTHKYILSQQGLATIVHRYIFILSVPMVTTEIEFPLELWNSDSLFFDIPNKKIKDAGAKLGFMWSVLCFSCLSRASRTAVIQPLDSDEPGWFWDLQDVAFYFAV